MIDKNNGVRDVCMSGERYLIFNTSILANLWVKRKLQQYGTTQNGTI